MSKMHLSTTWSSRVVSLLYRLLHGVILFLVSSNYRNDRLTEIYYRKHVLQSLCNSFNHRETEVYAGFRVFQKLA